jgi:peptidoglycan/LPS O-acetylase OafA/YrhL
MSRPQDSRLPYLPGIDALRAIAVQAVFLYHAGVSWMPGGYTTLIDWAPVAAAHENLLWDGIHLTPGGCWRLRPVGRQGS